MQRRKERRGKRGESRLVTLSKTLSYLLRHGAEKHRLHMSRDGFVELESIMALPTITNNKYTLDEVREVVENNDKKRFTLEERRGKLYIRANQGHSIAV